MNFNFNNLQYITEGTEHVVKTNVKFWNGNKVKIKLLNSFPLDAKWEPLLKILKLNIKLIEKKVIDEEYKIYKSQVKSLSKSDFLKSIIPEVIIFAGQYSKTHDVRFEIWCDDGQNVGHSMIIHGTIKNTKVIITDVEVSG